MSRDRKQVSLLEFKGARFEDHGLDVDVLPELVAYKRLLLETAKEIWRRKHPGRQRLPKNFYDGIGLKFYRLVPGSTGVPLERELAPVGSQLFLFADDLDEAANLLQQSIGLAAQPKTEPTAIPRAVVPLFQEFGKTLRDDEFLMISAQARASGVRYDHRVRNNILRWASVSYTDIIDITGEVRGTDLDGSKFTLRLPDGRKVPGRFSPEQEELVLEALGDHLSRRLRVSGSGEFLSEGGALQQIVSVDHIEVVGPEPQVSETPLWERLVAIGGREEGEPWKNVPSDLATNVDRYLYGKKDSH